ncbi:DNA cytosine methyltransferase [Merismopedia glauca]|uniref:Cytosine-specific methyltransferase n=1 Tax=Merismopedia glauca CCAP 1448/3 TaxID=1296344 RepID=A0A2T1C165_9CYAN|nr:DNA cytosine methyltransferase [Merismopedia glauca]PSB01907.1 DNA (cytosine-5-)-methyltransferase [Merismopedia glauca CCAP 1448/3]
MTSQKSVNRPIAVDLFAGAGGMTLGFEQAGFDVLAAVEIDPIHCATHKFNFPFWTILCKSVTETTGLEIRQISGIGNREIDVVFGGPPCQGFSLIGKRTFEDPRNHLVFHFIRLVLELKPKYFVMENVKGMTLGKHREFLDEIISRFTANGYIIQRNYQVLNAAKYGVPQQRERLFLLGSRQDLELPKYPEPMTIIYSRSAMDNSLPKTPSVWDAIGDLPEVENYIELYERDWIFAEFGKPSFYARKLRFFEAIKDDYGYQRNCDRRILTSSLRTKHSLESTARFQATLPGKTEPISRFHKLDFQGLSNTLRAGTASNRGAFTSPRPIHPFTPRCITVREAARLHSYPDWFRFHTTKWHGFRQIGNSVPPLLAKAVAEEIMKVLGKLGDRPKVIYELGNPRLLKFNMSEAARYFQVDPHKIEPRIRNINK